MWTRETRIVVRRNLKTTLQNALDIWSGFGKLQVKATPEELVSFTAVAQ